jgi:purine-binding chemotaxis protein CheW
VNTQRLIVCRLDTQRLALPVAAVERVFAAMATRPAPNPPPGVCGLATVHGDTVPVLDLRQRLGQAPREPAPSDVFVLARVHGLRVGFFVDAVDDVVDERDIDSDSTLVIDLDTGWIAAAEAAP